MRLLCRYAGGLACLVTALALVACGGGPGSQPEPKQIEKIEFSQEEKARTISLSDKFSGSDLTYSATTSDRSVATATVDNDADTLTVTAVGPGTAIITVTAKNSRGEADQKFTVTVPQSETTAPTVKTGATSTVSVAEGATSTVDLSTVFDGATSYTAESSAITIATASGASSGTLTITGASAGSATITVTGTNTVGSTEHSIAVTVTVPQPEATAPTVKTGATSTVSVAEGATSTVDLSTVFDGATSYTAESSAITIATASGASSGTLTIRGVSRGTATITIVATNDAGSATHPITVTVTAPPPVTTTPTPPRTEQSDCPERIEIPKGDNKSCTLTKGHSLVYTGTLLRVSGPPGGAKTNVWTITALLVKGRPVVQIREDGTGNTVGEITVIVPNTPPRLVAGAAAMVNGTLEGDATDPPATGLHTGTITDIKEAFEDDDTADTAFNYKVQHKPDEILIKTTKGFLLPENSGDDNITGHEFVVLKPFTSFQIEVYAYDQDNARSDRPATVTFARTDPVAGSYTVKQRDNGTFEEVRLGNRLDTAHTLTFSAPLKIATDLNTKLTVADSSGRLYLATGPTENSNATGGVCASNNADGPLPKQIPSSLALGTYCYTYTAGRRIAVTPPTTGQPLNLEPTITFQLPSKENQLTSGSDSITLQYFVGAYSQAKTTADRDATNDPQTVHRSATARVTLRIHKCVVTTDCPINSDS